MPQFTYRVYGLTLESDIEFPELLPGTGAGDVIVTRAAVPERLDTPTKTGRRFEMDTDGVLVRVAGLARYWMRSGRYLLVDQLPGASDVHVRAVVLHWILSMTLQWRGALVLHAGALVGNAGAVAIAGASGAGKSTLVATLARQGYRVLTDDVTAVVADVQHRFMVQPGYPRLALWRESLERLREPLSHLSHARIGRDKYWLPVNAVFCADPRPLAKLFVLRRADESNVTVESLSGGEAFTTLWRVLRERSTLTETRLSSGYFPQAAAVASRVPITRITRPVGRDSLEEIAGLVGESLR